MTKTRNHHHLVVRDFKLLGSARLPNVRTPWLRLRLPAVIHRVQRGEAKRALNAARLGEYLKLARGDLDRFAFLLSPSAIQKVSDYGSRLAVVGTFADRGSRRLQELMLECKAGKQVRFAKSMSEALAWLLSQSADSPDSRDMDEQ